MQSGPIGPVRCALAAGLVLCILDLILLGGQWPGGGTLAAGWAAILLTSGMAAMLLRLGLFMLGGAPGGRPLRRFAGAAGSSGRVMLLMPVATWAVFFFWADRALPSLGGALLHWAMLLMLWLSAAAGAWLLLGIWPRRWRPVGPVAVAWPAAALVLMLLAGAIFGESDPRSWRLVKDRTHTSGRLLEVARRLADQDGDGHSVILGGRDCDNGDPAVYPGAREVPGNGLDEDCDDQDGKLPPREPPREKPTAINQEQYRAHLATWRLTPGVQAQLARAAGYNVVLMVVDGLRADLLLPLEQKRDLYPNLTRLMTRSRRFANAFSSASGTDVGMTTMLTGKLRYIYRGRKTLARAFRDDKVRTYGVYQTEVERWLGRSICRQGQRGRRVLVNDPTKQDLGTRATSRQVSDQGIRFIRRHGDERFLLWLHYFDVHEHHQVEFRTLSMPGGQVPKRLPTPRQRYELMLRHVDHHVGRFLSELESQGLADKTMLVLTADHGEGLGESPRLPARHGELLYQPLVHVPLSIRIPGVKGRSLQTPVSIADLYPTLLDLAGLPRGRCDGISLVPYLMDDRPEPFNRLVRPIFMMESRQHAAVVWPLKLISWRDQARVELYDLVKDPREEVDLSKLRPEDVRRMEALLEARDLDRVDRRRSYIARLMRQRAACAGKDDC